jgi:hypothetical protein
MSHPTLGEIRDELARGGILEARIEAEGFHVSGLCDLDTGIITVNPLPELALCCIHELTHRLHPRWGEKRVDRESRWVLSHMTDGDVSALVSAYRKRRRKVRLVKADAA